MYSCGGLFIVMEGPKRWGENLSINKESLTSIFKSLKNVCKETRL